MYLLYNKTTIPLTPGKAPLTTGKKSQHSQGLNVKNAKKGGRDECVVLVQFKVISPMHLR